MEEFYKQFEGEIRKMITEKFKSIDIKTLKLLKESDIDETFKDLSPLERRMIKVKIDEFNKEQSNKVTGKLKIKPTYYSDKGYKNRFSFFCVIGDSGISIDGETEQEIINLIGQKKIDFRNNSQLIYRYHFDEEIINLREDYDKIICVTFSGIIDGSDFFRGVGSKIDQKVLDALSSFINLNTNLRTINLEGKETKALDVIKPIAEALGQSLDFFKQPNPSAILIKVLDAMSAFAGQSNLWYYVWPLEKSIKEGHISGNKKAAEIKARVDLI